MAQKKGTGKSQTNTGSSRSRTSTGSTKQRTKATGARSSTQTKQAPEKKEDGFHLEIVLIVACAVAIFLEVSNFGLCGTVGNAISGFLFGVFGCIQYILPILLFVGMAFLFANGFSTQAIKKTVYAGVVCLDISMLAQLIVGIPDGTKAGDLYLTAFAEKSGGGFIGGGLALLLKNGIGVVGSYLVLIVIILIMVILMTEKSFIRLLQNGGARMKEGFQDAKERGQEYQEKRQADRMTLDEARAVKQAEREAKELAAKEKRKNEIELRRAEKEKKKAKAQLEKEAAAREPEYDRFNRKIDKKLLRNLTVLPTDGEQGTLEHEEFKSEDPLKREEVHEITMTYEEETEEPAATGEIPGGIHEITMQMEEDVQIPETPLEPEGEKPAPVRRRTPKPKLTEAKPVELKSAERELTEPEQTESETKTEMASTKPAGTDTGSGNASVTKNGYQRPPLDLLTRGKGSKKNNDAHIQETIDRLQSTLDSFGVRARVTDYSCGPAVTRFELQPEQGVKVSKIVGLADDIKLNLAAADIRIEAPIPGKAAIGIEIPNKENSAVMLRDLLETDTFQKFPSDIGFAVGKDISGQTVVADIAKMPHLLIAGATGSGKSVCINTIIMSILYKADPEDVKLIMIDPKVVELTAYNGIPHLMIPVVTDPKKAAGALNWAVIEMTKRYQLFAEYNVRNLKGYNKKVEEVQAQVNKEESEIKKLPQIVVIVDELADLMMVAHGDVEDAIVRLSQLARAAGIHLVIATQRPSVDVITGLIKANVPSRIAFAVSSLVDSRTILDMSGAEKLLGKGDMLFYPTGYPKPVRVQGAFVSDEEVSKVVDFLKDQSSDITYDPEIASQIENSAAASSGAASASGNQSDNSGRDEYFKQAAELIIESEKASIGMLQRKFKVGFNRAARIMDQLAEAGVVGPDEGTKPRTILMSKEQFEEWVEEYY